MQSAPWLGLVPGNDGQVKHAYSDNTPFTTLLSAATSAVASSPACANPSSYLVMSKQAEAASKSILNDILLLVIFQKKMIRFVDAYPPD